jgi:hypothetical protein
MMALWRPLALAAALNVTVAVGVATAQTVVVTNAPPGSKIELVLNAATIGSATPDASGIATLSVGLSAHGGKTETDAHIFVDVCKELRRVLLVERGQQPPAPGEGCARKEIAGLFLVRRVTTLVVDVGAAAPAVWLRQGPAPERWLKPEPEAQEGAARTWRPLPTGLVLFGSGGLNSFGDAVSLACGNVTPCSGKDRRAAYTFGGDYWVTRFLAAEGSYLKPAQVTTSGSGDIYRFNSSLDTRIITVAGKVGVPIGPVRAYGKVGATYQRSTSTTTETIDDRTVTVDGVDQIVKGGTQTLAIRTEGWGWIAVGGLEAWVSRRVAIYGEVGGAALKGSNVDSGEGKLDEPVTIILLGIRLKVGR